MLSVFESFSEFYYDDDDEKYKAKWNIFQKNDLS